MGQYLVKAFFIHNGQTIYDVKDKSIYDVQHFLNTL